jgi:hypothetical protein
MGVFGYLPSAALPPATFYNLGLVLLLAGMGIAVVAAYRAWREINEDVEPATPEELLASFEQARADGELDEDEYARVRSEIEKSAGRKPSKPA